MRYGMVCLRVCDATNEAKKIMRRTFLIREGRAHSAMVPKFSSHHNTLTEGVAVTFTRLIDTYGHGQIAAGARGVVTSVHLETGMATIKLENTRLEQWDDCLLLMPFECDEWLESMFVHDEAEQAILDVA